MDGIHEAIPVVFEEQHFSLVNVVFHSILLGLFKDFVTFAFVFMDRFSVQS